MLISTHFAFTLPKSASDASPNGRGRALATSLLAAALALVAPVAAGAEAGEGTGATPVAACTAFFAGYDLARVDACAKRLAPSGWGLAALTTSAGAGFAGLWAAKTPTRTLEPGRPGGLGQDDTQSTPQHDLIGIFAVAAGETSTLVWERERGLDNGPCGIVLVASETMTPKTYAQIVAREAARGCVPRAAATVDYGTDDATAETDALFVKGDPREVGSLLASDDPATSHSEAEFAAFEARAAARGFQREKLGRRPDLFGRVFGRVRVEHVALGTGEHRYDALAASLAAASASGERPIDIAIDGGAATGPEAVDILWRGATPRVR